ncbi:hypothetical protein WA026_012665 [Henosepilachna vigintioctopunctata]|uniref:Uncharacterized protein n=1 Tax=Henosepilachna vigintioctopunctata TaxID=420089 RepID=A0AAW1TXN9_9CUCU
MYQELKYFLYNLLLNFFAQQRVLNVSEGVHEKVGHLCNNLNQISLRVDLARNEFNSICDSQFVECRVYEDDETLLTKEDQKGKVEYNMTENEKIEDLKKAVDLGLHILDEYYDKLEVPVSDSEEDEEVETPSYVYRRKDHYLHRPLPYVIGSEEWHKKWHVGLLESSDSEIEKSASDKFSDSEIDDDFEMKDQSDVSSEFSSAEDNLKGQKTINTSQPNDSFSSTGGPNLPSNTIPKGSTFAEQLAAKLGTIAKENEAFEESEVNRRPIHKKNTEYGALFSNEPPPLEDTVVKQQQTDGIFSSGKGLFDDEDDDNDTLWSYDKSKNTSSTDYLAFSRDGQFGERSIQRKGLFDEESDDDIFTENSYIKNQMKHPYLQHIKPVVPPFHEEPPLLENEQDMEANKKIDGSVSGFEKSDTNFQRNKLENISKKRIVKSSDECIEDTFCPNSIREVSKTNPISVSETDEISFRSTNEITHSNIPNISNAPKETKKIEDELQKKITDNLLEGINTSNLEIIKPTTEASYLFDDIFVDDLFSDTNKKFSSDLFTEEDLFPEKSIIKTSEPNKKSSYSTSVITSTKTFPEISDDESFEEKQADFKNDHDKSWRNISKNKVVSIFDDTDEDDFDTLISKKSNTVNDQNTKNLVQSEVQVCASEYSDVYPEFEPLEKGEVSIDIVPHEKIGRDEFITEKQVGQTYGGNSNKKNDKVHENTDDKYHEQCSWKQSFNIDDIHTVQNILQEQHLPIDDETSKYDFTTQSKETNDTIGSIAYSRSSDIPQVNFFDSTPPRDDGWDNNAANIFDDVGPYGIDDFQSRPSSLFDSEPPSLFLNDSSTVAQDILENRIDSVKYFDPNLTSSRRLSSDIFSDTDDDSNKVSKNIEYSDILIANSWTTDSIPGIPDFSSESNTDLTAIGSFDYIHSSASVNPAGEEIYPKSINREQSKESFKVDVDTPDELSGFSIQKPLCENEINSGDDKNNQKPTRRDSVKTDVFNKKQNGDISIDGEGKIEIENGKKLSVSGANTDKINTAHSLLDDSFDIGVDDDIFSDSDALLAEGEISSKQSDNGISASEITNMYIEKHIESGGSKISSDENPVVSYDDESSKKKISDMGFTHTTTQNNFEIIAKYPIETKPTTAQFKNTVHSEMEETSTFEVEHGDDFLDASSEYEKKSISLIHDSYDKEAKNIQSNSPMKKQDADINDCINRENVIRDNASVRKRVSFDENIVGNENNSREASVHREESDEMQNNISRIVERLQQISNIQEDNSKLSALLSEV